MEKSLRILSFNAFFRLQVVKTLFWLMQETLPSLISFHYCTAKYIFNNLMHSLIPDPVKKPRKRTTWDMLKGFFTIEYKNMDSIKNKIPEYCRHTLHSTGRYFQKSCISFGIVMDSRQWNLIAFNDTFCRLVR